MGEPNETLIGYDAESQELLVDRRLSGESDFSDRFAEVHRAPLVPGEGKIELHVFVDSCSVEVFANDGRAVISDLIFPHASSLRLELYAQDGAIGLDHLNIWRLESKA
jgi:sucrose-6-phosphate hydrolase SacC (GH32 family)